MEDYTCDACGREHAYVRVGRFLLCRACSSPECRKLATEVATAKHRAKLEEMLREAE